MTIEQKANAEIDRLNREIAMANLERVRWRRLAQQYAGLPDVWPDTLTTPHPPTIMTGEEMAAAGLRPVIRAPYEREKRPDDEYSNPER